ncbi:MAG: hypothetical protein IKG56_03440 [Clostridia bacterium]|nr:hypothetical protein [Clostridia bacterium]
MKKSIVAIYSIIHFVVDLSCAVLITNMISHKTGQDLNVFIAIIIYNFFAFAVQLPVGIIADKANKNAICSAIGCLLVAVAYGFANYEILACLIAGLGNSLFHVGGGIDVLNISDKKATLSGIFVSTGAMGIFLGQKSGSIGAEKNYLLIVLLIISALLLIQLYLKVRDRVNNEEVIIPTINKKMLIAIMCLIVTVVIRSYVGLILAFEWKSSFILALISIFVVVLGKMLGGVIGDRIGFIKTSLFSLISSAVLFLFAFNNSILGVIAILLFNMTMPITLTALSNLLSNNKGMAFGLLTLALFIGAIPVFFGYTKMIFTPLGLFGITIVSAFILYGGIRIYNELEMEED